MNSSDDVDTLFAALNSLPEDATARVPLLIELLGRDGHEFHEDIVFELGLFEGPSAIPAIAKAVETAFSYMEKWDNVQEFQRKCAYALARIGTQGSREVLEYLAQHENPYLREYGRECLGRWSILSSALDRLHDPLRNQGLTHIVCAMIGHTGIGVIEVTRSARFTMQSWVPAPRHADSGR